MDEFQSSLDAFVSGHALSQRPIAVVSSGGTAADLELNSVRCLENFSTGLRGAISVEEFLKRGYAVVHLWRTGSAAPYARVLSQLMGLKQANHCLSVESLGRLFAIPGEDEEDDIVQTVLDDQEEVQESSSSKNLSLRRGLSKSMALQQALQERSVALGEGRLLTVPFRSIEDYLERLEICSAAVKDCGSLSLFFLAAAVSDFYVPKDQRSEHKMQSHGGSNDLVLSLKPVPKTLGLLRSDWAPDAFVVSFKLETDKTILRQKADRAVENYGCHMVIGNLLHTRHKKVSILTPANQQVKNPSNSKDWSFTEVTRSATSAEINNTLESAIIDCVVQSHFEFISYHFQAARDSIGLKASEKARSALAVKQRKAQRDRFMKRAVDVGMEIAGAVIALALSYTINTVLRRRLN